MMSKQPSYLTIYFINNTHKVHSLVSTFSLSNVTPNIVYNLQATSQSLGTNEHYRMESMTKLAIVDVELNHKLVN